MERILGIDAGTNSLGWATISKDQGVCRLENYGVNIFQEGVKIEKGIESSKAAERTQHRSTRVRYYRTKLRKINLLRILSDNHLCPPLSKEELRGWRLKKIYPKTEPFMQWQSTDEAMDKTPYAYRHRCLHEKLDMDNLANRYVLGRALYHLAQRRGFLSNRKDTNTDETGKVKEGISRLSAEMHAGGYEYLGDYFYALYNKGEKIRTHYTSRQEHYLAEFKAICKMQSLPQELVQQLEKAIFFQRPLKSQKKQVGKCVFEKNKAKCPVSHPMYEEFRMLAFINNIKISTPYEDAIRPLNNEERQAIIPLFYRKSKPSFYFEEIAKKLANKATYGCLKRQEDNYKAYRFNYDMETLVSGCPVTTGLRSIFGEEWKETICETYTLGTGKSPRQIINDVWHALFFYTDNDKLAQFAKSRLQLNDEEASDFCKISLPSAYASLSLKAIGKILPYLRRGLIYSQAVFLGNLGEVLPSYVWEIKEMREAAIGNIIKEVSRYEVRTDGRTLEVCIKDYLKAQYNVEDGAMEKLYHPSMMETYPQVKPNDEGEYRLGSPRIDSVRNPMAMRSLFRLRKLINRLLAEGKIDADTKIHIEFARELNDTNKRAAWSTYQRENQKEKENACKEIKKLYKEETGREVEPTDNDVLKYILWEEQERKCIYTGQQIAVADFIGPNPKYDIEHTIPRSVGGDSTRMNLTLCDSRFNREVKQTKLPSELPCHEEILKRISMWNDKCENLEQQIQRNKKSTKSAATKEKRDELIRKRRYLEMQRDYWRGKYERFEMTEVPEGFSRRQGADIGIISKYARLYLQSLFRHVYTVKGIATSDFRKIWGIQELYAKKERVNHVHHCLDAIVIASIDRDEYNKLGAYYHDEEKHEWYGASKARFDKPWPTFVEDLKKVQEHLLIYHYTPDNMHKQGRRRILIDGRKVLTQGDAARGSLHNDTYYGAIERDGKLKYVKRVELASLDLKKYRDKKAIQSFIDSIVDDTVRAIVKKTIDEKGLKEAIAGPIWMNEEKQIPIKKVRCAQQSVASPLHIRQHRDLSDKEYKRTYYVTNDRNYMLALYIGKNGKGKEKSEFELVNMLQAAQYFRTSNDKQSIDNHLVPVKSEHGYPLAYTLKIGTMVLLYESSPSEVWEATKEELCKRLYKVTGLARMIQGTRQYAVLTLTFHEEARQSKEVKPKNGAYKQGEELRPAIVMLHTQIKALVQGRDFEINEIGEIKWLSRHD